MLDKYDQGRFDMLHLISSIEYGKQCYFLQDNDMVYSRRSCKYVTLEAAIEEFAEIMNDW